VDNDRVGNEILVLLYLQVVGFDLSGWLNGSHPRQFEGILVHLQGKVEAIRCAVARYPPLG